MVRFTLDLENLPPFTSEQKQRLEALRNRPDSEIDCSDIPPLTDEFFKNAIRNPFLKRNKPK